MNVAEHEQIAQRVGSALVARKYVMHIEDGGALSAEEATATAARVSRESESPDVVPVPHCKSHNKVCIWLRTD